MTTYLFVTSPDYTPERVEGESIWWSCQSTTKSGDRALVYVTGVGIHYEWELLTDAKPDATWTNICDVEHVRTFTPPIQLRELRETFTENEWKPPFLNFRGYRNISLSAEIANRIRSLRIRAIESPAAD